MGTKAAGAGCFGPHWEEEIEHPPASSQGVLGAVAAQG